MIKTESKTIGQMKLQIKWQDKTMLGKYQKGTKEADVD